VILDEIGRGTSTYDGVSLAWAMTEFLHGVGCRSLFATHYHELAQLAAALPRLRNYNVLVRELDTEIIFLHKIAPGSAERSYGIHVARLAGVPEAVLSRATAVLETLEKQHELPVSAPPQQNGKIVLPPEAPRRKPKLKPQVSGPSLFGDAEDVPF
jgi:DNA mismatch repair protein MutS